MDAASLGDAPHEMISEDLGIKLENVTVDMLGRAKRVSITKDHPPSFLSSECELR